MKYPGPEMSTFHVMCKTSEVTVLLSVFLVRSSVTLRARSTILSSVSPFACGSRVISRDSPERENLLAGYLRTFIRQSLLKLRIVKERAPENEPRIQLGVNSDLTIYYRRVFTNLSAYWACKRTIFSLFPPPPLHIFTFYFFVYCVRNKNLFSLFKP